MNILLVNHYVGAPQYGMAYRPYYLARYWVQQGHKVTMIGANYSHLRLHQPMVTRENIEGIEYIWLKTPKYHKNDVKRFINILSFIAKLFLNLRKMLKLHPDVIIASSTYPLDIFPTWLLAKLGKAKLIFELHDVWPLSPMELGHMSKWHPFIMLMALGEYCSYKLSNTVVSILPNVKEYAERFNVSGSHLVMIPNGIEANAFKSIDALPRPLGKDLAHIRYSYSFLVGFAGGLHLNNAMHVLIEAAALCPKVAFVIVGDGFEKQNLLKRVKELQLNNVFFLGRQPKLLIPALLSEMDALYLGWNHSRLYQYGISANKLFDYMMSGKPIIHSYSGAKDLVQLAGCGISVEAEDVNAVARAVEKVVTFSPETRKRLGDNGKAYVIKHHDYSVLAQKFLEVMK